MKSVETMGKTIEEAIENGLNELGVEREDVDVEVLVEPNRGFLGILGNREAKVRLKTNLQADKIAKEFLHTVCKGIGLDVEINKERIGDYFYLYISGNNMGVVIGRRGETLDAIQYLTNLHVNKILSRIGERARIIVDAEGYRKKREKTLTRLAERMAEKAKATGNKIVFEPMNPQERRIIHTALQGDNGVETHSEGSEPYRKVIVSPKYSNGKTQ